MNTHSTKFQSIVTLFLTVLYIFVIMTGMTEMCMCEENCHVVNHYNMTHSNDCCDNSANEDGDVPSVEITSSSLFNDVCSCAVWTAMTHRSNDAESFDINPRNQQKLSDIRISSETTGGLTAAYSQYINTSIYIYPLNSFASCKTTVLLI